MIKLEVKYRKHIEADAWIAEDPGTKRALYHNTSQLKMGLRFIRDFYKLIKGKTEFTLIGICEGIDNSKPPVVK